MPARIRLAIVDDEPLFLELCRERLAGVPEIEVVGVASSGDDALELARSLRPDAFVVDVFMPGMNGYQLARALRAELPETRLIMISADGDPFHAQASKSVGAEAFVDKKDLRPALLLSLLTGSGSRVEP